MKGRQQEPAKTVSQCGYARHRGCSQQYIHQLILRGILVLEPDGKLDVAASDARMAANVIPRISPRNVNHFG